MTNAEKKNQKLMDELIDKFAAVTIRPEQERWNEESNMNSIKDQLDILCRRLNEQQDDCTGKMELDISVAGQTTANVRIKKEFDIQSLSTRKDEHGIVITQFTNVQFEIDQPSTFMHDAFIAIRHMNDTARYMAHRLGERRSK